MDPFFFFWTIMKNCIPYIFVLSLDHANLSVKWSYCLKCAKNVAWVDNALLPRVLLKAQQKSSGTIHMTQDYICRTRPVCSLWKGLTSLIWEGLFSTFCYVSLSILDRGHLFIQMLGTYKLRLELFFSWDGVSCNPGWPWTPDILECWDEDEIQYKLVKDYNSKLSVVTYACNPNTLKDCYMFEASLNYNSKALSLWDKSKK